MVQSGVSLSDKAAGQAKKTVRSLFHYENVVKPDKVAVRRDNILR